MLPHLMVAPNGARRGKADHPALPITLDEILTEARACREAGADGLHLHLRDAQGGHLLDAGAYREALTAFDAALPGFAVQITTEAAGRYAPDHQRRVALESGARSVSVSIAEMTAGEAAQTAPEFYAACDAAGITVQHILYDAGELDGLAGVLGEARFRDPALQLICVLGRYTGAAGSDPAGIAQFTEAFARHGIQPDWALCAFGPQETACLRAARAAGGKCRVGFENSLWNADGSLAGSNAERVREVRARAFA
ncbi:3-keto-5-aminohexanoate cleavage protein [Pseudoruegeria sp. SHC-113]|uniref:3-keto-5-aminohexanoate cleavage protein n=1 Tax=Pseudoruegeria sp. SHC-113 TaxID=2855439 RepID=UPI0021BAD805|nr:3-keto-5-aminohexanoate cleavage protein [Pseudoruegeria sp. SHC-113]MCT8161654.1 3-keto-5-aminohexanoate cleavage protein [Pseudoruegeria sp. SHC-113]